MAYPLKSDKIISMLGKEFVLRLKTVIIRKRIFRKAKSRNNDFSEKFAYLVQAFLTF